MKVKIFERVDCPGCKKPIRQRFDGCALTDSGHALPEPITDFMKSRRLIADHTRCLDPSAARPQPSMTETAP